MEIRVDLVLLVNAEQRATSCLGLVISAASVPGLPAVEPSRHAAAVALVNPRQVWHGDALVTAQETRRSQAGTSGGVIALHRGEGLDCRLGKGGTYCTGEPHSRRGLQGAQRLRSQARVPESVPWHAKHCVQVLRRFLKKNILSPHVEDGRIRISHLGNSGWRSSRASTSRMAFLLSVTAFWYTFRLNSTIG